MDGNLDIITVIAQLGVGFQALGMEPPEAIILATHEDGMRFLHEITQEQLIILPHNAMNRNPVAHPDGSLWMEVEVYGCKVRWPANKIATQGRGYVFV